MEKLKVVQEAQAEKLKPLESVQRYISEFHTCDETLQDDLREKEELEKRIKYNQERLQALTEYIVNDAICHVEAQAAKTKSPKEGVITFKYGRVLYTVNVANKILLINAFVDLEKDV